MAAIVLAVMPQLLFRKRDWPYGVHLMFALHYVPAHHRCRRADRLGLSTKLAATAGYTLLVPYLVIALKRVYPEPIGLPR